MTNTEVRPVHAFVMVREKDVLDHLADMILGFRHRNAMRPWVRTTPFAACRTGSPLQTGRGVAPAHISTGSVKLCQHSVNVHPLLEVGKCPTRSCAQPFPATETSDALRGHE